MQSLVKKRKLRCLLVRIERKTKPINIKVSQQFKLLTIHVANDRDNKIVRWHYKLFLKSLISLRPPGDSAAFTINLSLQNLLYVLRICILNLFKD
ncbi:hypothetical protein V1478_005243 [Vespula squamosa]|uniref:Uncharacterized protein n=1 Tax=Vespula squamosa TaxID=30214 RepID=A0ABD2BDU9_VESSQ